MTRVVLTIYVGRVGGAADDIDVEGRPREITRAELGVIDGHVLCSDRLGIYPVKEGYGPANEYTGTDIAGLCRLFRRFRYDGDWRRVEGSPYSAWGTISVGWQRCGAWSGFCDVERELETLCLRTAGNMEKLEAAGHIGVKRRLLLETALASLADNGHGEVLGTHLPYGALDMDDWRWTKETLLVPIALLGDCCMETDNGSHWDDTRGVMGDMVADNTPDFCVWVSVVSVGVVKLALGGGRPV